MKPHQQQSFSEYVASASGVRPLETLGVHHDAHAQSATGNWVPRVVADQHHSQAANRAR